MFIYFRQNYFQYYYELTYS